MTEPAEDEAVLLARLLMRECGLDLWTALEIATNALSLAA